METTERPPVWLMTIFLALVLSTGIRVVQVAAMRPPSLAPAMQAIVLPGVQSAQVSVAASRR